MDILQQSASAWKELTEYRYQFVYGYKKTLYPINLTFSYDDYPHLAGFQYLKNLSLPNYTSAKIVDRILEGKIFPPVRLQSNDLSACHLWQCRRGVGLATHFQMSKTRMRKQTHERESAGFVNVEVRLDAP